MNIRGALVTDIRATGLEFEKDKQKKLVHKLVLEQREIEEDRIIEGKKWTLRPRARVMGLVNNANKNRVSVITNRS